MKNENIQHNITGYCKHCIKHSLKKQLNLKMYTSACRTLLNAFDVTAALKEFDINQIVHIFPSKIMELLTERLRDLILMEGPVAICYHNTTITADFLLLEMSVQFDIDTIEDMVDDGKELFFFCPLLIGAHTFFFPYEENYLVDNEFKKTNSFFCWKKNVCHI